MSLFLYVGHSLRPLCCTICRSFFILRANIDIRLKELTNVHTVCQRKRRNLVFVCDYVLLANILLTRRLIIVKSKWWIFSYFFFSSSPQYLHCLLTSAFQLQMTNTLHYCPSSSILVCGWFLVFLFFCSTTYNWTSFGIRLGIARLLCALRNVSIPWLQKILIDFTWCWSNRPRPKNDNEPVVKTLNMVANFMNCSSVTHKFHHRSCIKPHWSWERERKNCRNELNLHLPDRNGNWESAKEYIC